MHVLSPTKITLAALILLLSACGGDSEMFNPTASSNIGGEAGSQQLPYPPTVAARSHSAPADGATLSGFVRLEVEGYRLVNVELLPAEGYSPKHGAFVTYDGYEFEPEQGWLDLDTMRLPNGPINVRISGFDSKAGEPGNEVVMMPARTWYINNASTLAPLSASVAAAPANGAALSGIIRLEVSGSGLANVELLPATGYAPKLGTFNISADRSRAWLDFDTRAMPDGVRNLRISAFNVTPGQSGAREIVAMPARQWNFRNGATSEFTARLSSAPIHGDILGGKVHLEVTGAGLENVELLPANGYAPKIGSFHMSVDKTRAFLDFNPADLPAGVTEVRISAFSKPAGQSGAREIVVMPARQWDIRH